MMRGRGLTVWGAIPALLLLTSGWALRAAPGLPSPEASIGRKVAGVSLRDGSGKSVSLGDYKGKKALVLVFIGTECPMSNGYAEPLSQLADRYRDRGVQFVGVNANANEAAARVAKHAQEFRFSFPVLKDEKQVLANAVGARVTPEAFVLDSGRVVRYRGRIDDAYQSRLKKKNQVGSRDLEAAIEAVLAGKKIDQAVTAAYGCAIVRPQVSASAASGPSFHKDVLPILQERCQSCHRPGQVAPFSLLTFEDARNWSAEIKAFTQSRQMPPWKPEPGHGEFQGVRRLSDAELTTLAQWADSGAPQGDPKAGPEPKKWPDGWMLGEPDLVLTASGEYQVTATGEDDFRCFVLPTGLKEDRWVVAVEMRPGNPRVVHHVLNFIDTSGRGRQLDEKDPELGYSSGPGGVGFFPSGSMGGWAPGNLPRFLPEGVGQFLPAGSDIVMQVHYHKTGKPEKDRTQFGLYFAKKPVEKRMRLWPFSQLGINIPPGETRHPVTANMTVPLDIHAISVTPHMHLLGREMKVWAVFPDGTEKSLIWIKDWDYRWQDSYRFKEALALPKGTKLFLQAYFDNSAGNPLQPNNPPKRVTFGEQTTDEMCFAFLEYTLDVEPKTEFRGGRLFGSE